MLPTLRAERQMVAIEASSVPHMKPEDRRDIFRRLVGNTEPMKRATASDLASMGIEIVEVDAEGRPKGHGTSGDETEGDR